MDNFLVWLIDNKMKALGYTTWRVEYAFINTGVQNYKNEHLFLVAKNADADIKITADNRYYRIPTDYATYNYAGIKHFTGVIEVTNNGDNQALECIRVIPQILPPANEDVVTITIKDIAGLDELFGEFEAA